MRIKCLELKLKTLGRRSKKRLGISRTKREEKIKEKGRYYMEKRKTMRKERKRKKRFISRLKTMKRI